MTNQEIETKLKTLVSQERALLGQILELIREAERRRIWADRGFSSMHEWLVTGLGYSEGAAYRRLSAARLSREVPDLESKIEAGALTLSAAASLQTALRAEERRTGLPISATEKADLVRSIEGKTKIETERIIAFRFPEAAKRETLRAVGEDANALSLQLSAEARKKLERVRELLSQTADGGSWADVIERLADEFLKKKDPMRRPSRNFASAPETSDPAARVRDPEDGPPRREISAAVRRAIVARSGAQCEYRDPNTGRRCSSRSYLQVDHVRPRALGGSNDPGNLRCLCAAHNQARAEKTFGSFWRRRSAGP